MSNGTGSKQSQARLKTAVVNTVVEPLKELSKDEPDFPAISELADIPNLSDEFVLPIIEGIIERDNAVELHEAYDLLYYAPKFRMFATDPRHRLVRAIRARAARNGIELPTPPRVPRNSANHINGEDLHSALYGQSTAQKEELAACQNELDELEVTHYEWFIGQTGAVVQDLPNSVSNEEVDAAWKSFLATAPEEQRYQTKKVVLEARINRLSRNAV